MHRAVFLDLDETIVDYSHTEQAALTETWREFLRPEMSQELFLKEFHRVNDELWDRYREGSIDLDRLRTERFHFAEQTMSVRTPVDLVSSYYEGKLTEQAVVFPDAVPFLTHVADRYTVALVTNGIASVQHEKLARTGIRRYFDLVVVSEEAGYRKPDPRLLRYALDLAGCEPAQAVFIGDSLASDGACARDAQVDFCWVNRRHEHDATMPKFAEVSDLMEIAVRKLL